jgi:hypothetical protein
MVSIANVAVAVSRERLDLGFRASTHEDDATLLARYIFNLQLCEALYPVLHATEVALRNRVDAVFSAHLPASKAGGTGADGLPLSGCWLDANPSILAAWEQGEVQRAKKRILAHHKAVTSHRVIADLSLGFWTGLFTRKYETSGLWPLHLKAVFPSIPRPIATRHHAYKVLTRVADLRNHVFHHRPVWRLQLNTLHVLATEVIGWISPDLKDVIVGMDRFPLVYGRGLSAHIADVKNSWDP